MPIFHSTLGRACNDQLRFFVSYIPGGSYAFLGCKRAGLSICCFAASWTCFRYPWWFGLVVSGIDPLPLRVKAATRKTKTQDCRVHWSHRHKTTGKKESLGAKPTEPACFFSVPRLEMATPCPGPYSRTVLAFFGCLGSRRVEILQVPLVVFLAGATCEFSCKCHWWFFLAGTTCEFVAGTTGGFSLQVPLVSLLQVPLVVFLAGTACEFSCRYHWWFFFQVPLVRYHWWFFLQVPLVSFLAGTTGVFFLQVPLVSFLAGATCELSCMHHLWFFLQVPLVLFRAGATCVFFLQVTRVVFVFFLVACLGLFGGFTLLTRKGSGPQTRHTFMIRALRMGLVCDFLKGALRRGFSDGVRFFGQGATCAGRSIGAPFLLDLKG